MATPKKPGRKLKPGRPERKIKDASWKLAADMLSLGATHQKVIKRLGVSHSWYYKQLSINPRIKDMMDSAVTAQTANIQQSLYKRAAGYKVTREKPVVVAGELVTARYKEHIPADVGAAKFWLTNRAPEQWSERKQLDIGVSVKRDFDDEPALEATVISEQ